VVTVVLPPAVVGTLLQGQLIPGALHPVQEDRTPALTEVGPAPRLGDPPGGPGDTRMLDGVRGHVCAAENTAQSFRNYYSKHYIDI